MHRAETEPWLRGTHSELAPVFRGAIHALELAQEDLESCCSQLTEEELHARPFGLPSIAFQLRHIARSLDRLLTYAEDSQLSAQQLESLGNEADSGGLRSEVIAEVQTALELGQKRIRKMSENPDKLPDLRVVGGRKLPTTVAGLLVHVADHTQRHVGQTVTTTKVLLALRS